MAANPFDAPANPLMFEELPRPPIDAPRLTDHEFPYTSPSDPSAPVDPESDYAARVRGMVDDAREFVAEVLTPIRERGLDFYFGFVPELEDEGRSTIVKTEVRDTILAMLPSLMRIFTAQESVVSFMPTNEASVEQAEQETDYINHVLMIDNPGYTILIDTFKDAMIKGMGLVTWWTDQNIEAREEMYTRLSLESRQFLISQPGVEVVSMDMVPTPGPQGEIQPTFDMTIRRTSRAPTHRVAAFPPDEFRVNRQATCIKDAGLVGREWFATQTFLIGKGVPRELVEANKDFSGGDLRFTKERMLRNAGSDSPFGRDSAEPVARYGEYWIRIDKDNDGLAELRHICVIGDNQHIVHDEPANRAKIALACVDPEPHSIVGHSISELVADLQVIGSNLLRGSLDSLAQSIYPRLWGVENQVDWDDMLNSAIGAPIRVKSPDALGQLQYAFIGEPAFTMMDRLDAIRIARTGITEQSKGLDPKALQSTTLKGVEMLITGAQERIELVARTMAQTFVVDLFSGLLAEVTENPAPERVIELRGKYVTIQPSQFDQTMHCIPNPAMGRGSDMDRWMMLQFINQQQVQIIQSMGPANPMVTPIEYRNCLEDMLKIASMKNSSRYFKPIDQQELQMFMQQLQAKEDPNLVYAKAEADKVRAQVIKILTDARVKTEDLSLSDDRDRDKNETDAILKAAEIDAKYGASVDTAAIQALWKEPRQPLGAQGPGGEGGPPGAGNAMAQPTPPPAPGPKPPLPTRTALGAGPPQLSEVANASPPTLPAGLLGSGGAGPGG
jgi:hypothetical protein